MNRTEHATLTNEDPCKLIDIVTMFIKMHKGVIFDDKYLDTSGLDGFMRMPMSVESFTIPEELSAALSNTINNFKGVQPAG